MAPEAGAELPALGPRQLAGVLARLLGGLAMVFAIVGLAGYLVRDPTELLARRFVDSFGVWGLALGTLLADGLHFPIPPQFYLFTAVASRGPDGPALLAIIFASIVAGYLGYALSERAARLRWLAAQLERPRRLLAGAFERYGYRAALLGSVLPIPYSVLCNLAGLNRLPRRFLAILALCRVPKLLACYWLIRFGWA